MLSGKSENTGIGGQTVPGLPESTIDSLLSAAKDASEHAYAPYSGFRVGAAILTQEGKIYCGANVENASYDLTICAERTAVCQAAFRGMSGIRALAVYTPTEVPTPPCGACRQALREFSCDADVFISCDGAETVHCKLDELLPMAFGAGKLVAARAKKSRPSTEGGPG